MAETAGKVYPVHNNVFKFGTKGMDSVDGDMAMPKDLENFSPSIDGTVEEWYAMDAGGWAKSAMTDPIGTARARLTASRYSSMGWPLR